MFRLREGLCRGTLESKEKFHLSNRGAQRPGSDDVSPWLDSSVLTGGSSAIVGRLDGNLPAGPFIFM